MADHDEAEEFGEPDTEYEEPDEIELLRLEAHTAKMDAARMAALGEFLARAVTSNHPDVQGIARALLDLEPPDVRIEQHGGRSAITGWWAEMLAEQFIDGLRKGDGSLWNSLETIATGRNGDELVHVTVTVQRVDGETPAQQLTAARAQIAELEARIEPAYDAGCRQGAKSEREAIARTFDERAGELTKRAAWTRANCTDYESSILDGVVERIENDAAQCRQDAALIRARQADRIEARSSSTAPDGQGRDDGAGR